MAYFKKFLFIPLLLSLPLSSVYGEKTIDWDRFHKRWDIQLKRYVFKGKVNYPAWNRDSSSLNTYLDSLRTLPKTLIQKASKDALLALYINTYNAYTIKAVLNHPKIKSIQDIKPKIWDQKFIHLSGDTLSLNHLENKILRPQFKDPRIHFAIVCASISCPPLINKAYTPLNVHSLMTANTKSYLADKQQNDFTEHTSRISKIFKWFKEDFEAYQGGLKGFLKKYAPSEYEDKKIFTYMIYNWDLNSK